MATLLGMLPAHCNSEMQRRGHRPKTAQAHGQNRENEDHAEAPYSVSAAALASPAWPGLASAGRRRPGPRPRLPQDALAARGSHSRPRSSRSRPRPPLTQFCALLLSLTFLHRLPGISMAANADARQQSESPRAEPEPRGRGRGEAGEGAGPARWAPGAR